MWGLRENFFFFLLIYRFWINGNEIILFLRFIGRSLFDCLLYLLLLNFSIILSVLKFNYSNFLLLLI